MSHLNHLNHLKIPLQVIKNCTQDFDETNFIGKGGYGRVYKGILSWADHKNQLVAVKRLDVTWGQGNKEFYTEIVMLSRYRHKNIITLLGFCDDNNEMILIYEYASHGSLDTYLSGDDGMLGKLSWPIRLNICIGIASALDHLHNHVAEKHRIIHRDIKSANILLDENWNAKLSDFGLCRVGLSNQQNTFLITNIAGTHGYCDPEYERTGILTKESDVYSLGVILFEILCGRLVCVTKYHDERRFLHHLARTCYKNGWLDKIIDLSVKEHINPGALRRFSTIAYRCLQETRAERPTIAEVLWELKYTWTIKEAVDAANLIQMRFRSFIIRKQDSNRKKAAKTIQRVFRSYMVRKKRTVDAANLIQMRFRSFIIRKHDSNRKKAALTIQKNKVRKKRTLEDFREDINGTFLAEFYHLESKKTKTEKSG